MMPHGGVRPPVAAAANKTIENDLLAGEYMCGHHDKRKDATGRECLYEEFEVFAVLRVRTCCCWWRQEERALER